jgi:uncharacterized protein YqjF (DUF2071 family)
MFLGDSDPHLAADSSLSVVPLPQQPRDRWRIGAPRKLRLLPNYRPVGPVYRYAPGSLDSWLTDRYCLSAVDDAGNPYRGEIDHDRWPLQQAAGEVEVNTLGDWLGIEMKGQPATLHSLEVRARSGGANVSLRPTAGPAMHWRAP